MGLIKNKEASQDKAPQGQNIQEMENIDGEKVQVAGEDKNLAYSAILPEDWVFIDLSQDHPVGQFVKSNQEGQYSSDSPFMQITISGSNLNLDQALQRQIKDSPNVQVKDVEFLGLKGKEFTRQVFGKSQRVMIAVHKGRTVQVSLIPDLLIEDKDVQEILDSLILQIQ